MEHAMPAVAVMNRRRALLLAQARAQPQSQTNPAAPGPHAITGVKAFQVAATQTNAAYIVLQIRTASGLTGYGECRTLSSAELKATVGAVTGRAATSYEVLDPLVPPAVRGALNMALLDILGKATNAPIYRLLGGPTRNKARAITRLSGNSDAQLVDDLKRQFAAGYRAFLLPIPPPAARNQGSEFVRTAVTRFEAMRAAEPTADLALECSAELSAGDAAALATALERQHPLWFDEPCAVSNIATLHKISDETVVPLGFGRDIANGGIYQQLLREGVIDLLRLDVHTHGITGMRKLAALAETYYVDVAPWHEGGPIANAAALHAAACIPNFYIAQLVNPAAGSVRDGYFTLSAAPGLGVEVDERQLEKGAIA
jgi:galactonate dehydratase